MTAPLAYGIDFGTTNSLVSVAYPDRIDLLAAENDHALLPSIVYLHREGDRFVGESAVKTYGTTASARTSCGQCSIVAWNGKEYVGPCRTAKRGGGCYNARLIAEIKRFLTIDRDHTHSWGIDFTYAGITTLILRELKRQADRHTGSDVRRAVVGHPIAFAGAEGEGFVNSQRRAVGRLKSAATEAGFDEVELLEEPAAALSLENTEGFILALDFGGGTFDTALIESRPDRGIVRAMHGAAVGGEDFDEHIFRSKIWPLLNMDNSRSAALRKQLKRRSEAVRALANDEVRAALADGGHRFIRNLLYGGHIYNLFRTVEDAKIALSDHSEATISFHRPDVDIEAHITRKEFEALIQRDIDTVFAQIEATLRQASVGPSDVTQVVRTGGSSSIPLFVRRLDDMFGKTPIVTGQPFSRIVMGLASHARRLWLT